VATNQRRPSGREILVTRERSCSDDQLNQVRSRFTVHRRARTLGVERVLRSRRGHADQVPPSFGMVGDLWSIAAEVLRLWQQSPELSNGTVAVASAPTVALRRLPRPILAHVRVAASSRNPAPLITRVIDTGVSLPRLWKLPDLWTRRACAHRSLENYTTVFHELPQALSLLSARLGHFS